MRRGPRTRLRDSMGGSAGDTSGHQRSQGPRQVSLKHTCCAVARLVCAQPREAKGRQKDRSTNEVGGVEFESSLCVARRGVAFSVDSARKLHIALPLPSIYMLPRPGHLPPFPHQAMVMRACSGWDELGQFPNPAFSPQRDALVARPCKPPAFLYGRMAVWPTSLSVHLSSVGKTSMTSAPQQPQIYLAPVCVSSSMQATPAACMSLGTSALKC
ncbi:hypothetical protein BP5796_09502 [Coleophoma crateriformis]|uniref:Uncharacterized protein n=1 Tax=Coleophoma crateriformis TaxID=565419 RepID=A0A3D8QY58_9HELO|nr:hypothetical protein BP5796_09502 [Coleophoma crateriformis]